VVHVSNDGRVRQLRQDLGFARKTLDVVVIVDAEHLEGDDLAAHTVERAVHAAHTARSGLAFDDEPACEDRPCRHTIKDTPSVDGRTSSPVQGDELGEVFAGCAFFRALRERLQPGGAFAFNVLGGRGTVRSVARAAASVFDDVRLVPGMSTTETYEPSTVRNVDSARRREPSRRNRLERYQQGDVL
jgi:hypothetical protein